MAGPTWDNTLAEAKKILGKDAKIPDKKMSGVFKNIEAVNKLAPGFKSLKEALEKGILDYQNGFSKVKNSLTQADEEISDDDYGLDPKNDDDKKKIMQAQKLFKDYFSSKEDETDGYVKDLDELDKHVIHISKYRTPDVS